MARSVVTGNLGIDGARRLQRAGIEEAALGVERRLVGEQIVDRGAQRVKVAANVGAARVSQPVSTTASFGLALLEPDIGVEESIDRADKALLVAKAAGRNRVCSWDPAVTTSTLLRRMMQEGETG